MKVTQSGPFLDVSLEPGSHNFGDNGDTYTFTLEAHSQAMLQNGEAVFQLSFTLVGGYELEGFFEGVAALRKLNL